MERKASAGIIQRLAVVISLLALFPGCKPQLKTVTTIKSSSVKVADFFTSEGLLILVTQEKAPDDVPEFIATTEGISLGRLIARLKNEDVRESIIEQYSTGTTNKVRFSMDRRNDPDSRILFEFDLDQGILKNGREARGISDEERKRISDMIRAEAEE